MTTPPDWLAPLRWIAEALGATPTTDAPAAADAPPEADVAAELRASAERYRGIVETQEATVMRLDLTGRITFVNESCCRFSGVPRAEILGRSYGDWVHPDDHASLVAALHALQRPPYRVQGLTRVIRADGTTRWLEWDGAAVLDEHGAPVELQSVGRDVTARLEMEAALQTSLTELRVSEEKLRSLARHQAAVREDEQKRLGLDLHEGVGQELVGITILVEAIRRRLGPLPTALTADFNRVLRYLGHVGEHMRALAGELRPLLLHDLGLEESVRALANGAASPPLRIDVVVPAAIPRLDEATEIAVYRIAQEALANALRHARASRITVTLVREGQHLRLDVRDDGAGFDAAARAQPSLGIVGMEERALALGGRLVVESMPNGGTTVRLECPWIERASAA